jgi:predicted transcriptional regulator of viral defense system
MKKAKIDQVIEIVRKIGILRPRDLDTHGIPREYLIRLSRQGRLEKLGRGLYQMPQADITENHSLAEACKKVPNGIICLLSALRFHGLTTQLPFEVWLAIDRKARIPKMEGLKLRVSRFSKEARGVGVEDHVIEGVKVRVFSPAKTVVDCFKYRNKIGLDVALEALRDCRRQRKCTNNELWHYAKILRVSNVMRPYLEATI